MKKSLITCLFLLGSISLFPAHTTGSVINCRIIFEPDYGIHGYFSIDTSIIGPSFSNQLYGTSIYSQGLLTNFRIIYGGFTYYFDPVYTNAIVEPSFPYVIALGSNGEVIDIKGALNVPGTFNDFLLGREGFGILQHIVADAFGQWPQVLK